MPAMKAATTESMPQMASSSRTTRLLNTWKSSAPTEPRRPPKSTPARPASAADRANTASLVLVRSSPRVAQAAWLSDMAASWRPNQDRRRAMVPTAAAANTTAMSITKLRSPAKEMPSRWGRPTRRAPPWPKTLLLWKKTAVMASAKAKVMRPRYRPWSRSAGNAARAPTAPARATAARTPSTDPPPATLPMAKAPKPTNVS